ncbi:YlxR family protein [Fusibacter bizertensis]|uniref:YlxR family protein n=1 Tax=Fusibacter bizertensis TaxID=1488331 RepID=A0ABT6N851_9FIRM|nr:YlxR family protein [Fusibacter bizertensis]MDH8676587.1 YlxR family protein [Fusibacter bizertensis]
MNMKKIPMRKCIACGVQKPKKELIRVVKNNENEVFVDFTGKANGRGAYICKDKACFDLAIKKNAFNRALETKIEDEVFEKLKERLDEHE